MPQADAAPLFILARSGGQRITDSLEIFPSLESEAHGVYETRFFLHGLSHMPKESAERASKLTEGEQLLLMWDFENPKDPEALALRTAESYPGDMHLVGYYPRYLRGEILKLMTQSDNPPSVNVVRVNATPAPVQFRVLCQLRMKWLGDFEPFSGVEYQPIVTYESKGTLHVAHSEHARVVKFRGQHQERRD